MRLVDAALQDYMTGHGLHMTRIVRLGPFPNGSFKGLSFMDINIPYDDGEVELTYIARTGAQMSDFVAASDLTVDNAEMQTLSPIASAPLEGITDEEIRTGRIDSVPFIVYAINYKDLTPGRHFIWNAGTIGEVRMPGSALLNLEQRSITNKLLQVVGEVDSTTCRAKRLGTQYLGNEGTDSSGETIVTEKFPCLYPVSQENVFGTLTGVDADEPDLIFQDTALSSFEDNRFAPGTILFLDGDNEGIEREIDAFEDGIVLLKNSLPRPAALGDSYRIRRECTFYATGHNSCQTFWGTSWVIHFRGEPLIPVADAPSSLIAGAAVPTDIGGTGEPLPDNDPGDPDIEPGPGGGGVSASVGTTTRTHGATVIDPNAAPYNAHPSASAAANSIAFAAAYAALPGDGGIIRPSIAGVYQINTANPVQPRSNSFTDFVTNNVRLKGAYSSTVTRPDLHRDVIRVYGKHQVEIAVNEVRGYLDEWNANGGESVHGVSEWAQGIYISGGSTGVTIRDMTITDCVGDCVSVGYSADDVVIDNFNWSIARRQGGSIACDNFSITNGEISYIDGTIPQCGIDIEPDNANTATNGLIQHVHIHHCAAYGILVAPMDGGAVDIQIDDCTIEYNSLGIVVGPSANGTQITNCTIRHNRNPGVRLQTGSANTSMSGNTFWDNSTGTTYDTVVTSEKNITGTTSETAPHIQKQSGTSATIGSNTYQT